MPIKKLNAENKTVPTGRNEEPKVQAPSAPVPPSTPPVPVPPLHGPLGDDSPERDDPVEPEGEKQEPMVLKPVYNPEKNQWEKKMVPASEARVLSEVPDRADAYSLDTTGHDPDMQGYWGSSDPSHPSNIELRMKGYAPVREAWSGCPFVVRDVPGIGRAVTFGSLVLYEVPKEMADKRRAREISLRERDQWERMHGETNRIRDAADSFDGQAQLIEGESGLHSSMGPMDEDDPAVFSNMDEEDDYATGAASQLSRQIAERQRRSFGGFRGPMGPGVPESPAMRRGRSV